MKELDAAVDWWANVIMDPKQDNGDYLQSSMLSFISRGIKRPSNKEIEIFKVSLKKAITEFWREYNIKWNKFDPTLGSYDRCISVDYRPCSILARAAKEAGISENLFPCKTSMWIDPGSVKVSYGYRALVEEIYRECEKD